MAHEIATAADGRASIAYANETPWHGLGQQLSPNADLITWQQEAGLDWEARLATVKYDRTAVDQDGIVRPLLTEKEDSRVIYRSDTGEALSVVSDRYRPVQPREVIQFYRDLTEAHGFQLETAGALKGGRKIWALAKTPMDVAFRGGDVVNGYLLLATSFDGSMATQARFTSIRVVCNNTLTLADRQGRADVTVPHSTHFDADKVKLDLKVGDAWAQFSEQAKSMTERVVSRDETVRLFLDVYHGLTTTDEIREFQADPKNEKTAEKFMARMTDALFASPGANLASAKGTLWGALQAITFDVDHQRPARSQENRLDAAWFGAGEALKQKAWSRALAMVS